ncbi:MAG: S8 family serine peptidase, partial [bacterium]|nr:S8 family serine peptidase [bacterium]
GHNYTNPNEKYDGRDSDGNGYVDDVHGIAYDLEMHKNSDLLYTLGEYEEKRTMLEDQLKGFMDLQAAIDSPESAELRKKMSTLEKAEVKPFFESLSLYAYHAHGTHVAGIAIEGNPYASVLTSRLSFDHHMTPMPYTNELCERFGASFIETVQYFKDHDVRVVNMSWGLSLNEIEDNLAANGIGESAEKRAEMAREMFNITKADLYKAMKDAPGILFVAGAGNSDNDVEFDDFIPSGFDLPNVLVSGAVDQAGEPTSFTSFGSTVTVYSNGFEVDSYVPGGRRMKLSGTSMASPNVANLAAKLIAKDPTLTPHNVIQLIEDGADDFGTDNPMLVINPKKSLELLTRRTARKSG